MFPMGLLTQIAGGPLGWLPYGEMSDIRASTARCNGDGFAEYPSGSDRGHRGVVATYVEVNSAFLRRFA